MKYSKLLEYLGRRSLSPLTALISTVRPRILTTNSIIQSGPLTVRDRVRGLLLQHSLGHFLPFAELVLYGNSSDLTSTSRWRTPVYIIDPSHACKGAFPGCLGLCLYRELVSATTPLTYSGAVCTNTVTQ